MLDERSDYFFEVLFVEINLMVNIIEFLKVFVVYEVELKFVVYYNGGNFE